MGIKELLRSKTLRAALAGMGVVAAALVVFSAGVRVGFRKASFGYRWGENYHRNFGGPHGGFMKAGRPDFNEPNPHGAFGEIIRIDSGSFVLAAPHEAEKLIVAATGTAIRRGDAKVPFSDLKVGDHAVIIGSPNDEGRIEAKLIRLLPPPEALKLKRGARR